MCKSPNYLLFTGYIRKGDPDYIPKHEFDYGPGRLVRDYKFVGHLPHDKVVNTLVNDGDMPDRMAPYVQVPCGQCLECRIQQTRVWADRCVLEAKQWNDNYFITLTYDDCNVPSNGSLNKRDYQLFLKRLRKRFPDTKIRYLISGEYGDRSMRPHFHLILFNLPLKDLTDKFKEAEWELESGFDKNGDYIHKKRLKRLRTHSKPPQGQYPLYYSKTIHECWDYNGMISVGRFSYDTAAYISQYCTKKVNPKNKDQYAKLGIIPEFLAASTHPGIGAGYAEEKDDLLYAWDKIVIANKDGAHLSSVPRYFDKLFIKKYGEDVFEPIRYKRLKKTAINEIGIINSDRDYDRENLARDYHLSKRQKLKTAI